LLFGTGPVRQNPSSACQKPRKTKSNPEKIVLSFGSALQKWMGFLSDSRIQPLPRLIFASDEFLYSSGFLAIRLIPFLMAVGQKNHHPLSHTARTANIKT
jgi:hypothetical protein